MHNGKWQYEDCEIKDLVADYVTCKLLIPIFEFPAGTVINRIKVDYFRSVVSFWPEGYNGPQHNYKLLTGLIKG